MDGALLEMRDPRPTTTILDLRCSIIGDVDGCIGAGYRFGRVDPARLSFRADLIAYRVELRMDRIVLRLAFGRSGFFLAR